MTFALGFKACMLSGLCDPQIHIWCKTCWLYRGQHGSWAFSIHILADHASTSIGMGSNPRPSVPQAGLDHWRTCLNQFCPGNRKISIEWCHSYYLENVFLWECYVQTSTLILVYFLSEASERSKLWIIEAQSKWVQERRQHYGPGFCIHRSTKSTSKGQ